MADPLTPDEVGSLLSKAGIGYVGSRDRAYLSLLYGCGLRNNECRMLDLSDLRQEKDPWTVRVRHPKGEARGTPHRELGVPGIARVMLSDWLSLRGPSPGPLFLTASNRRVDTSHYRRRVPQLAKAAGIVRRVHPHAFRHTFAREMNDEGVSMRIIQLALGHSNLNTTATYLQSLGDPEVIAATGSRK